MAKILRMLLFLSTPSARRATIIQLLPVVILSNFYPRPPRGGRPYHPDGPVGYQAISIHALREEGDRLMDYCFYELKKFLSTPSARRATHFQRLANLFNFISIHALREEGDGRLSWGTGTAWRFLSTPSARRATAKTETKSLFSNKLYNILHEFRRALIYNGSKNYPNHAKRLKNPVRRCRKNAENSPFAPGRKTQNNSRPSCSKGG